MAGWFVRRRAAGGGSGGVGEDSSHRWAGEAALRQRLLSAHARAANADYGNVSVKPAGAVWSPENAPVAGRAPRQSRASRTAYQDYGNAPYVFSPPAVTSATLIGWWRSDRGVFQNTAMTTPTVVDGQSVLGWQDRSGAGHHLTEATNAPIWKTNQVNGFPSVRFDGVNDLLTALFTLDIPFDYFLVVKQIAWTEGASLVCGGTSDNFSLYQHSASPGLDIYNGVTTGAHNTGLAAATWGLVEAGMPSGGGNDYTLVNAGSAVTGGAPTSLARGGTMLGAHPGAANFGNVEFAEVLLYNGIVSAGEATSLRTYFTGRYGFP